MSDVPKPDNESPRSPHHVLDELKNVLSGLGQPAEPARSTDAVEPPLQRETTPTSSPFSIFSKEAPPVKNEPAAAASDADFWSGNVLGWPSGTEESNKSFVSEASAAPLMPAVSPPPAPPTIAVPPVFVNEIPETSPTPIVAPIPVSVPTPATAPIPVPMPAAEFIEPPSPADRPPWPVESTLPEPPAAPASPAKLEIGSIASSAAFSSYEPTPPIPEEAEPVFAETTPPAAQLADPFEPAPIMTENPLDSGEEHVKPKDLVQLACYFPEGSEKIGQQFAKQLRDLGAQSVPSLVIEPVLVSSWSLTGVDMTAWNKSAELSGADIIFILTPKKDMQLFHRDSSVSLTSKIAVRLIAIEHVALRTLYSDILIELKRRA